MTSRTQILQEIDALSDVEKSISFDIYTRMPDDNKYWTKVKVFMMNAWPSMMFLVLGRMQETVVIIFVGMSGRENSADLIAGFGIGTFFVNLFFNSIIFGLNGALETLVS